MSFSELHIDMERNSQTDDQASHGEHEIIVKAEPRETIGKDGEATVTLSEGGALHVVESYKSLKMRLKA
jgi:hypothetical protein